MEDGLGFTGADAAVKKGPERQQQQGRRLMSSVRMVVQCTNSAVCVRYSWKRMMCYTHFGFLRNHSLTHPTGPRFDSPLLSRSLSLSLSPPSLSPSLSHAMPCHAMVCAHGYPIPIQSISCLLINFGRGSMHAVHSAHSGVTLVGG